MTEPRGVRNWNPPNRYWPSGTEYGGVQPTMAGGIQPGQELDAGDQLRLGYVTGQENSTDPLTNIDDLRQAQGLRPSTGKRPLWLEQASPVDDPRLQSEANRQGYTHD